MTVAALALVATAMFIAFANWLVTVPGAAVLGVIAYLVIRWVA